MFCYIGFHGRFRKSRIFFIPRMFVYILNDIGIGSALFWSFLVFNLPIFYLYPTCFKKMHFKHLLYKTKWSALAP